MWVEILLGGVAVLFLWMLCRKPSDLPPGRWGLPLVGYIPLGGKYMDDILLDMQKKYGDIYIWRFGTQLQVYVHDYNLCRQVFSSQDFVDRPDMQVLKADRDYALGVAGSNGALWHMNRRFSLRQLRDLGMGKSNLVGAVHFQASKLLEALKKNSGKTGPVPVDLNTAIVNVIWKMVANKQFENDDPRHRDLQRLTDQINASIAYVAFADMFPWVKFLLPTSVQRKIFQLDAMEKAEAVFFQYFDELIEEHKENLDPSDPKDLMDAYIIEMNEMKENGDAENLRSEDDLKFLIFDMFVAGSDTTKITMRWMFLYMAAYPEIQRKLQEEIDQVLPKGILGTLEDKTKMPYTEAITNEVLRKSSLANVGFPHSAVRDTTVAGYRIPKGTMVISANAGIHHDPRYWDKPDEFLPERWLSSEGKAVTKKEGFLPFGTGKRACLGESLARMEIFILTTAVFQNFTITPPDGKTLDLLPDFSNPITHESREQDLVFTLRE